MNTPDAPVTIRPWAVFGWAMYDFANTIFSFAIISFYFNDWLIDQRHAPDWYIGATGFVVAIFLIATLTPMGAVADALGRRKPFLIVFTLACVCATAALGFVHSIAGALILVGIANFCYQSALSHYDPLLADIAPPEHQGRVSGIGVSVGYVGAFFALVVLAMIVPKKHNQEAFLPTAAMFLMFSLPIFFLVKERGRRRSADGMGSVVRKAMAELSTTARNIRKYGSLARFLLARFLYADALLTVIAYVTVYLHRVGGFEHGSSKNILIGLANAFAIIGGLIAGFLVERVGPKRVIVTVLACYAPILAATGIIGLPFTMWIAGPATGAALGSIWTSDRVLMLRLTTAETRGEFFGVYNLVGKLSSGLGPFVLWGGTIWLLHSHFHLTLLQGSRAALCVLAVSSAVGALIVSKVEVPEVA